MRNWGALGGIVYVATVFAVFAVVGDGPPETSAGLRKYFDEDYNAVLAHVLVLAGAVGLILFAAALRRATDLVVPAACFVGAATLYLVLDVLLLAPQEAAEGIKKFSYDPSLVEMFDAATYFTLVNTHSLIGVGALLFGFWAFRTRSFARWFSVASIVLGAIALASAAFLPMVAAWLWLLVASIVLARRTVGVSPAGTRDDPPAVA